MKHPFPPEAVPLLLGWYRMNARDLPWRENKDPYRVLLSEIMLQQTRAETVKPYFRRFLSVLPTIRDLADAPEDVLLKLWEGLGYYSRARNLQKAARKAVDEYGGVIPADFDALLSLPGVGRYTAGAVASIAYDIPVPAVDGNVLRVLARLCDDDTDVMLPAAKAAAEAALAPCVPSPGAGDFTQSLIELGALVCLPGEPKCADCPCSLVCRGRAAGHERDLPVRSGPRARRVEQLTVLVVLYNNDTDNTPRVCLRRRPGTGLLAGLWEFPHLPGLLTSDDVTDALTGMGLSPASVTPLGQAKHLFTHVEWDMTGYAVTLPSGMTSGLLPPEWVPADERALTGEYAVPSAFAAYRGACMKLLSGSRGNG